MSPLRTILEKVGKIDVKDDFVEMLSWKISSRQAQPRNKDVHQKVILQVFSQAHRKCQAISSLSPTQFLDPMTVEMFYIDWSPRKKHVTAAHYGTDDLPMTLH